jgi:hypothetical protein
MAAIVRWRLVNRSSISSDSPRVDGIARATANSLRFVTNLSRAAIRVFACSLSSVISYSPSQILSQQFDPYCLGLAWPFANLLVEPHPLTLNELFDVGGAIRNVDEYFARTIVSSNESKTFSPL